MTYTVLALVSTILVFLIDKILKTNLIKRKMFWSFQGFVFVMNLLTNGYLTWRPIVLYNPEYHLGIRIGTIPVEDFFYGFSLVSFSVILFEYFLQKRDV